MLSAYFAATGRVLTDADEGNEIDAAFDLLIRDLSESGKGDDPLGLAQLDEELATIFPHRHNVGYETRMKMVSGFERYFHQGGKKHLPGCW